jgi:hypothetical protein
VTEPDTGARPKADNWGNARQGSQRLASGRSGETMH